MQCSHSDVTHEIKTQKHQSRQSGRISETKGKEEETKKSQNRAKATNAEGQEPNKEKWTEQLTCSLWLETISDVQGHTAALMQISEKGEEFRPGILGQRLKTSPGLWVYKLRFLKCTIEFLK